MAVGGGGGIRQTHSPKHGAHSHALNLAPWVTDAFLTTYPVMGLLQVYGDGGAE